MNLVNASIGQLMIPVEDFERLGDHVVHRTPQPELWLAEFTDPDGNQLALMAEVNKGGKQ